ncbi:NTP transferase domain-containing protein [Steroidobacter sp. S1-65]|uniref:Molybdenum cofactor guanylyltransferase n=1 Tax=Steroidobacter gossypii TaxID=2805490 RepID=A0ABS1WQR8_9GAMM|nr:NTP transferase domain-containing protein [Steroidobacter gossypii]MBM0103321.1 NTP transferase domain-containing protein [Steroidobacter gossypii]
MSAEAPLFGLVLAGGASTRMQRDKAAIEYHGRSQLQCTFDLLTRVCTATFVSVRPDQREEPTRARLPQIVDRQPGIGPIAGITAALQAHPKAAWLVVACDLPFLNEQTLRYLIEHRDARKLATAFKSSHDGLPEPLCAIWEPASREPLLAYLATGKQCPRKFLINAPALLLDLPDARALDNVNTADEHRATLAILGDHRASSPGQSDDAQKNNTAALKADGRSTGAKPHTLRIQYYAILREQAGRSEETLDTTASTPAELYDELRKRHPFQLAPAQLKVALNSEFSDWQTPLRHGDTVVFIPPVAGG